MALLLAILTALQAAPVQEAVRLDLPETVELKVLIDYVATALKLNVVYDEAEVNKKVSLRIADPIPKEKLLDLLRTVLRGRGLALVEAEQSGWLKVVAAEKLPIEAGPPQSQLDDAAGDAEVLTLALSVAHVELERVKAAVAPYLSKPGGTLVTVPESRLLLVTDYARNVRRVVELAKLLDVPSAGVMIETIALQHGNADEVGALVERLVFEQSGAPPLPTGRVSGALRLQPDPIGDGLIATGSSEQIASARRLIERFDVPVQRSTELYQPKFVKTSRLRTLSEPLLGPGPKFVVDDASNTLIVTARAEEHRRLRELLQRLDNAPETTATPLRFYKLLNRRAEDVFATLAGVLGGGAGAPGGTTPTASQPSARRDIGGASSPLRSARGNGSSAAPGIPQPPVESATAASAGVGAALAFGGDGYSIAVDVGTNSIIAIATPEIHRQIEQLVRKLDLRRPQVLVEVTLVSITVDDSLSLGVELEQLDLGDAWDYLLFSSFGQSSIDPTTGARRLNLSAGGTGVLIGPSEVPIILNALQTRGNTRIYSAPRILVDDNASGRIESVAESPFTSVNASTTVATTSFAGFAKAGTQLTIEPHIAEGNHLEIRYDLTVSSFTGAGSGSAPPPRSSDNISSTVRVPDSYTVVVGGLLTETIADSVSQLPFIGDVPGLGLLFGNRSQSQSKVRLYAFIRPTVLREETFEDLKYISAGDLKEANVGDGFPPNRLQLMH